MAASNVNVVVITGNLTKDPELRSTGGGTSVCEMRVAVNSRRKDQSGQWVDKPNYFDVVVFGAQAENCANYLSRGRPLAVEGRLDWREWEAKEGGGKRQAVQIIANSVQFLGSRDGGGAPNGGGQGNYNNQGNQGYGGQGNQNQGNNQGYGGQGGDVPADESDFGPVSTGGGGQEDDIPF
ncbi:MAG TPA: single-stranded DNA-binding protein [Solirubrobacterales bacterium]